MKAGKLFLLLLLLGSGLKLFSQDVLLKLTGREIPVMADSVDTFFVFYYPLGNIKYEEKSNVKAITPHQLILKDNTIKDVVFDLRSYDINSPYVPYREKGNKRKKKDRYNFFSLTTVRFDTLLPYQDSINLTETEKVLYAQDSLHRKFEFSENEMRAIVHGRRSARKNFISPWSTMGGVAAGAFGGLVLNFFYASVPSIAYCSVNGAIKPPVGKISPSDSVYVDNEFFEHGYQKQARILKAKNSVLGTVPALAVGMIVRWFGTFN